MGVIQLKPMANGLKAYLAAVKVVRYLNGSIHPLC